MVEQIRLLQADSNFRHLFRNAYLMHLDPERLNIVLRHAVELRSLYPEDLDKFLKFLEQLAQTDS